MSKEELGGNVRAVMAVAIGWFLGKGYIDDVTAGALGTLGITFAPFIAAVIIGAWSTWAKRANAAKRG